MRCNRECLDMPASRNVGYIGADTTGTVRHPRRLPYSKSESKSSILSS